mgnify:CR=1 FL=1
MYFSFWRLYDDQNSTENVVNLVCLKREDTLSLSYKLSEIAERLSFHFGYIKVLNNEEFFSNMKSITQKESIKYRYGEHSWVLPFCIDY